MPLLVSPRTCCGVVPLELGCNLFSVFNSALCLTGVVLGWWQLLQHAQHQNEDNMLLMSVVMFGSLALISCLAVLLGHVTRRGGWVQSGLVTGGVFLACLVLVGAVGALFSPALRPLLTPPAHAVLAAGALVAAAAYCVHYLVVVNSAYRQMKAGGSAVPV